MGKFALVCLGFLIGFFWVIGVLQFAQIIAERLGR